MTKAGFEGWVDETGKVVVLQSGSGMVKEVVLD